MTDPMVTITYESSLTIIEGIHLACATFFVQQKRLPREVFIHKADFDRLVGFSAANDPRVEARSNGLLGVQVFGQYITVIGHSDLMSLTVSVV